MPAWFKKTKPAECPASESSEQIAEHDDLTYGAS
jgi:hypothetical protein